MNGTHNGAGHVWDYAAFYRNPVNVTAAQATAITAAIVKQCAGKDGGLRSDNFLTDPATAIGIRRRCNVRAGPPMRLPA
jgi:hypothetical protein